VKKTLFCILIIFTCVGLFAQQQPVVAVAPFDAISGVTATEANMISRAFNIRLGNTHKVILVDRDVIERVLREHHFQAGDWSNQQKTAALGEALNANWIVRGNFERFGSNVLFTVSFYDIATFQFKGGDEVRVANADAAYDHIPKMVNELINVIERGTNISSTTPANAIATAQTHFDRGEVFRGRNDWDTAILEYTEAIRLNPNYAEAYFRRGYVYDDKDDLDRAIADLTQAIRINSNYFDAYRIRGFVYGRKMDRERAVADYTQAIRINPDHAEVYNSRGIHYENMKDYDRAIADYTQAIRINPNYAEAYFNRGDTYEKKGDRTRAIADYEAALRIDPNHSNARSNLNRLQRR
jgi:tetratricopeptide (TPR) repeat protein